MALTPRQLTDHLRSLRGVCHKLDLQATSAMLDGDARSPRDDASNPAGALPEVRIGDDCAAIPDGAGGYLLFAIEGLLDEFVVADPWFAGYCAVMVNLSDVYSMGGRPLAIVDALWASAAERVKPIWDGMLAAATKYEVPIVGGHTNVRSAAEHLAAAVLGRAHRLLSSFDARAGDVLVSAIDLRGAWYKTYPYWNASTAADGPRLRADLEILPLLAEAELCSAAKDISMGGLVGTATMLAECSGVGVSIDTSRIPSPPGVAMEKWLSCFPSFGFLMAVAPTNVDAVIERFTDRHIAAAPVGEFNPSHRVTLVDDRLNEEVFWNLAAEPFIGFGPSRGER